jgi:hypothetical protein
MPQFGNYMDMPTLPTGVKSCVNVEFFMGGFSNSNLQLYSLVVDQGSAILESLNSDYLSGTLSTTEVVTALESYSSYLNQALVHLGTGSGSGSNIGGWTGWYWHLAEQTSWFGGWSTNASCNQNRNNLMQTHADLNLVRADYWVQLSNVHGEIAMYEEVLDMSVEEAELDSLIAYWENLSQNANADTEKSRTEIQNMRFANAVEMISIGGAVLIIAYTGFKTIKNK